MRQILAHWQRYTIRKRRASHLIQHLDSRRRYRLLGNCHAAWWDLVVLRRQGTRESEYKELQRKLAELEAVQRDTSAMLVAERARGEALLTHLAQTHSKVGVGMTLLILLFPLPAVGRYKNHT